MDVDEHHAPPVSIPTPLGNAHQVSTKYFMDEILPKLPPFPKNNANLQAFIDSGRLAQVVTGQGKLWGFTKKNPSGIHRKDVKQAFKSVQRGIRGTIKAVTSKTNTSTLTFYHNKKGEPNIEQRTEDSLPDAFFLSHSAVVTSPTWPDIAAFGEYMINATPESMEKNIKKLSESLTNCLRTDPCRRFVFAFTAEDATMRLWYCDRMQILVSEPFNFVDESDVLLHFAISLAFAKPHKLGWDPTMTRVPTDDGVQYDITVHVSTTETVQYRTLGVLAFGGAALEVMSRATRVWKAVKIEDGKPIGDPVALKDVWVDSDREREGDIVSRVLQSKLLTEAPKFKTLFIPVHCHGDVLVEGKQDRTSDLVRFRPEETDGPVDSSNTKKRSKYVSRTHYRIVYGEIGEPLQKANSLHKVFRALSDVILGALVMHRSGWVHRDLSPGNIIIVNGVGKITDLEFATPEGRQGKPGRTGTAPFVAVEVDAQGYLFEPIREDEITAADVDTTSTAVKREFRYNPLHDLESIWWDALHFVLNRSVESAEKDTYNSPAQHALANDLFHLCQGRSAVMLSANTPSCLRALPPSLKNISSMLEEVRRLLQKAYSTAEAPTEPINFRVGDAANAAIHPHFEKMAKYLKKHDVRISPLHTTTDRPSP